SYGTSPGGLRPYDATQTSSRTDYYFAAAFRRPEALRSDGRVTGWPDSISAARRAAPKSASASTRTSTSGLEAITSTRRPCSSAVLAVAGPMTAMTVEGCGLPAMPTRLRTVDE